MTVQEGNKIIAEFMGASFSAEDIFNMGHISQYVTFSPNNHPNQLIKNAGRKFLEADLIYHSSWDWLMPVVEKIEAMGEMLQYWIEISGRRCTIYEYFDYANGMKEVIAEFGSQNSNSKIHATWLAVTSFITWYNSQNL